MQFIMCTLMSDIDNKNKKCTNPKNMYNYIPKLMVMSRF